MIERQSSYIGNEILVVRSRHMMPCARCCLVGVAVGWIYMEGGNSSTYIRRLI
jgi:hypothetical protein